MMSNLQKWKEKIAQQEEARIGDIYAECEKRGCSRDFAKAFDTRAFLFPEKQAKSFMSLQNNPSADQKRISNNIRQYHIFLEVLIEKRPKHEKHNEWERALKILEGVNDG